MKRKCKFNKIRRYSVFSHWQGKVLSMGYILFSFFVLTSCEEQVKPTTDNQQPKLIYYCPMHTDVQRDHPGKCPKPECKGMELVLKEDGDDLELVVQPVSSVILSKIKVVNPIYASRAINIEASGYLDYDNYSKFDISSRYSGRIEKLHIKYNYQPIKKGDIVFEIYSPDLVTAQENLLYLLKGSPNEKELINAAREKLKLLQLTDEQIKQIETTGKVINAIPVFSKYTGHIHEMLDVKMDPDDHQTTSILSIKEGMYVDRGKILFNVADPQAVVAMLKIKSTDIEKIRMNEKVMLYINNDSTMKMSGKVDFIEPVYGNNSKTLMIRVNLDNMEHKHKIGSLVNAEIRSDSLKTLWIPTTAIVDLGKSKIVWVLENGSFKARIVETGVHSMEMTEISDGLTENDKIATEGHYLSDSESFIKTNNDE